MVCSAKSCINFAKVFSKFVLGKLLQLDLGFVHIKYPSVAKICCQLFFQKLCKIKFHVNWSHVRQGLTVLYVLYLFWFFKVCTFNRLILVWSFLILRFMTLFHNLTFYETIVLFMSILTQYEHLWTVLFFYARLFTLDNPSIFISPGNQPHWLPIRTLNRLVV